MFTDWRYKRSVRQQLAAMEKQYYKDIDNSEAQSHGMISIDYRHRRSFLEGGLKVLRTQRLAEKASRLGINVEKELPDNVGAWWHNDQYTEQTWLTSAGEAKLSQLIHDKKYEIAKKWSDLFSPIIATIISLIALAISIYALLKN